MRVQSNIVCIIKMLGFSGPLHTFNRAAGGEAAGCFKLPTFILFIAIYGVRITAGHVKYIILESTAPVMLL